MQRRSHAVGVTVVVTVLALVLTPSTVTAASATCEPLNGPNGGYIVCTDAGGRIVSVTPTGPLPPGTPPPDPATFVDIPYLTGGLPGGALCVADAVVSVPGGPNSALAARAEQAWLRLIRTYQLCPGSPSGPSVAAYAEQFIRTIALPVPAPRIAPGLAITGKPGYLETGSTLHPAAVVQPTPFGPLQVTITGFYFVHWGDEADPGAFSGPFPGEGLPWPDGTITHTWTNVGQYTIVVEAHWTATWQLGPDSGVLTGLVTRGTIAPFPVEQLQAVVS